MSLSRQIYASNGDSEAPGFLEGCLNDPITTSNLLTSTGSTELVVRW